MDPLYNSNFDVKTPHHEMTLSVYHNFSPAQATCSLVDLKKKYQGLELWKTRFILVSDLHTNFLYTLKIKYKPGVPCIAERF